MTDQTPDPWALMVQKWRGDAGVLRAAANPLSASDMEAAKMEEGAATLLYCAEQVDRALAAERAQHQQEIAKRDETIRQLQDAFARCQEVQQATAETWRIEHDQMAEQIRLLRGAMAADDERLRRAAEQAGILYVSCDTAEALAEQITRLSAQVAELEAERAAEREAELADPVAQRADRYAAEASDLTLRLIAAEAERDAAQQQIATLTQERNTLATRLALQVGDASELAKLGNLIEQWTRADAVQHGERWDSRALKAKRANELIHRVNATLDAAEARCAALTEAIEKALGFHQVTHTHAILSAALQSTRPQESRTDGHSEPGDAGAAARASREGGPRPDDGRPTDRGENGGAAGREDDHSATGLVVATRPQEQP